MKQKGKPGRKSTFDEAIVSEICQRLSLGEPLAQICRDDHMPSRDAVYDWEKAHPEIAPRIARARESGEEYMAEQCLEIADGQEEDVQRSKLRIWTRLQLLAKWNPRKYGEKVQVGGDASGEPIKTELTFRLVDGPSEK